jgi:hypothetical protein
MRTSNTLRTIAVRFRTSKLRPTGIQGHRHSIYQRRQQKQRKSDVVVSLIVEKDYSLAGQHVWAVINQVIFQQVLATARLMLTQ